MQEHNYNCRNFPFQSSTARYGSRKEEEKEKTSSSSMLPMGSIAPLLIFYRRAWRRQRRDGSDRRHVPNVPLSRRKEDRAIKKTNKPRQLRNWRGLMKKNPGGDPLLRDLSSDYHWRGSVSLPGSERDRVGPLRSGHRASGGRGLFFSSSCLPGSPWGALRGIF